MDHVITVSDVLLALGGFLAARWVFNRLLIDHLEHKLAESQAKIDRALGRLR